jgi:hypothetical protein
VLVPWFLLDLRRAWDCNSVEALADLLVGAQVRVQYLDRHRAIKREEARTEHRPHPASPSNASMR